MGTVIVCVDGAQERRTMAALIGERMDGRVMPYLDWTWDLDEVVMEWPAEVGLDGPDVAGCVDGRGVGLDLSADHLPSSCI